MDGNTLLNFWQWLHHLAPLSVLLAGILAFAKWGGNNWVNRWLNRDLEEFKREQQEKLESVKAQQQQELERFRHLLSSRVSRIHEKEFEVLPKAWLMLHELRGATAHAIDITFRHHIDFEHLSVKQLHEFLKYERAANRLSEAQAERLLKIERPEDQQKYYMDAVMSHNMDQANEMQRLFVNYLIENRIFMNDALRTAFDRAEGVLISALTGYEIGSRDNADKQMVIDAQRAMAEENIQPLFDDIDRAIQKRLRYAEAD